MGSETVNLPPKPRGPFVLAKRDLIVSKVTLQPTVPPTVTVVLKNIGNSAFPKPGVTLEDHVNGFRIGILFIDPLRPLSPVSAGPHPMSCHTNGYAFDILGTTIAAGEEHPFSFKLPTAPDPPLDIPTQNPSLTLGTGWWLVVIPNMISSVSSPVTYPTHHVNNWHPPAEEWRPTNNALVAFVTSLDVVIENPEDK